MPRSAPAPRWRVVGALELRGAGGEPVDLRRALASHGVAALAPQTVDVGGGSMETAVALADGGAAALHVRTSGPSEVVVEVGVPLASPADDALLAMARRMLGLDQDLSPFYRLAARDKALAWVVTGAGRMLRSPTVFEDLVKTVCTTNCAWSATVRMVTSIVEGLGVRTATGRPAFPTPAAMAAAGEGFYREVPRAGYRSPHLQRLGELVSSGDFDPESLRDPARSDDEVRKALLSLPGVGPYAAAHVMLISLGRYRDLVLDSWTRPTFAELSGKPAEDADIVRRFRRFGDYAGLAFWLYLTRRWVEDGAQ